MKSRQEIIRLSRQKQKRRLLLILLSVMLVSIAAAILLVSIMSGDNSSSPKSDPPEILAGESLENNYPIAYPTVQESQIQRIIITNKASYKDYFGEDKAPKTSYALVRDDDFDGQFVLYYEDKDKNTKIYYPKVANEDVTFDYESLYSVEQSDGYGRIYKLTYLCVALELPYFTDRIALLPEGEKQESQLRGFGLDDPQVVISFDYVNENKETVTRNIKIGDRNVTGFGYYFMVTEETKSASGTKIEYRPYIYNSMAEYYNYAMLGFYSYVNSILVSAGLEEDSSYEPYLTTDYKQWKNSKIEAVGTPIEKDSTAIAVAKILTPVESRLDKTEYEKDKDRFILDQEYNAELDKYEDGYHKGKASAIEIDLSKKDGYEKFAKALVGQTIGVFGEKIVVTLHTDTKNLYLDENTASVTYTYEITEIESIITDGADVTALGTTVGDNNLVRVKYKLKINGKSASEVYQHGVLDLSNTKIDSATIRAAKIGELSSPINLTVVYTAENSINKNVKYVVDEIIEIYNEKGQIVDIVTDKCQVYYRYCFYINGVKTEYETGAVNFATDTSDFAEKLKAVFVGKDLTKKEEVKNLGIKLFEYTSYYEYMQDFITYEIGEVKAFVVSKLISAFAFQNKSERDSFYGESIYENKMTDKNSLYAINSATCETVVKMLGGIADNSNTSAGLVGIENVAVGITPEMKDRYGLYTHTVYFELPRGVISIDSGESETVDDYSQYQKLGFTLFISDETFDPDLGMYVRFVGSDMYDIISKVDAEKLKFLNYVDEDTAFVEFWARKSLMIFDINNLESLRFEFLMDDLKGDYEFYIPHISKDENSFDVVATEKCLVSGTRVHTETCGCRLTKLTELRGEKSSANISLLYTKYFVTDGDRHLNSAGFLLYGSNPNGDTAGVGYFRELVGGIYSTSYGGYLTMAEQQEALNSPLLMRMSVKLDQETAENTTTDLHVYEFYRLDDRRIMVCQYQADAKGNVTTEKVTDFYISTLAFKRIVGNAFAVLNAEVVDQDVAYPEVSK